MITPPNGFPAAEFSVLAKRITDAKTHQEFSSALDAMTAFLTKQRDVSFRAKRVEEAFSAKASK